MLDDICILIADDDQHYFNLKETLKHVQIMCRNKQCKGLKCHVAMLMCGKAKVNG